MQNYQEILGETFDRFTEIGSGGGGTIIRAHHKRLDKDVVLKKIHTKQLKNIDRRGERDILKNLKNNYIPQILDFIEYGDNVFTVMEYIEGQSFAQLLEQNYRFAQRDVVKWMRQLCEVVHYLHSQKPPIIHCDIKPANVMLTPQGDICLIDFNISGVKTEEGMDSIGYSNGYAPVEQFAVVARRFEKSARERAQRQAERAAAGAAAYAGAGEAAAGKLYASDGTEILPGGGREATEILYASDGTEILPGAGRETTEILYAADGTEILPGAGRGTTEILYAADGTEILPGAGNPAGVRPGGNVRTETWQQTAGTPVTAQSTASGGSFSGGSLIRSMSDEDWAAAKQVEAYIGSHLMIDERTDIYSVGATLYHILCGRKPQPFYREQIPVKQANENVSDSVAYVIEKAMALNPAHRFKDSAQMLKTVQNMGKVDKRYKSLSRRQLIAAFLTAGLTVASAFSVSLGISTMAREKRDLYHTYIENMETAREEKNFEEVAADYGKAVALLAEEPEAYYEMGMAYYEQKRYQEGIDFLSENVYTNSAVSLEEGYGRFYFITASCYFELEDYNSAISYYERAVVRQSDEMAYYRDYVVALARNGQVDRAEQVLQEASRKGISADVMSLLNGEIALLKNDFQTCQWELQDCIANTGDNYIKLRAYSKLDDAYRLAYEGTEQYDLRIALLTEALEVLPADSQITLMERLAQVYIDYSDIEDRDRYCESAIALFDEMESRGYATFTARYNVAVLYEKMGRYEESMSRLNTLLDSYPDQYMIYKRMAFVELDIQAEKAKEDREYHTFEFYYNRGLELYQDNASGEDMEMLSLQELYEDVVTNGWL